VVQWHSQQVVIQEAGGGSWLLTWYYCKHFNVPLHLWILDKPIQTASMKPHLMDQDNCAYIDTLLQHDPAIYLDEVQAKLLEDCDITVSVASIQQAIAHLDISWKGVSKEVKEWNDLLRVIWGQ
jgi:hypothetical protein